MDDVLRVTRLEKIYGGARGAAPTAALRGLSLAVRAGEFVGVMGPSGSGKTTLLNLLAGIDTPTAGDILIGGRSLGGLDGERLAAFRRRALGFVFQDYNLLDTLTLAENVSLPLLLDGRAAAEPTRRTLAVLGIEALADRFPHEVSGGQQQRAAIARAIVHDPSLVLADEPTGNLDSRAARLLLEHFAALNERRHLTILMVTHDPRAASYANRVIFLRDGALHTELARDGRPSGVFFARILDTLGALDGVAGDA